jgi:hypothetical protein
VPLSFKELCRPAPEQRYRIEIILAALERIKTILSGHSVHASNTFNASEKCPRDHCNSSAGIEVPVYYARNQLGTIDEPI